ncbi:hypothetical protein ACLBR6_26105, partial [Klebsiella pneumoniae]
MNVIQPRMLSVFDFDGTLTRHDSFIPFLRFAFGNRAFSRRIVSMALPTLRCMRKQMTRDELKETLITTFLTGVEEKGTVAKLAMRQPFVLFKGLTFQKLCLPGAFRPG